MNTAAVWDGARRRIQMQEVGPRDGLQVEPRFVETADKIALVDELSAAGLAKIEVTSFVSPKAIPQLRDAEIVLRGIRRVPGSSTPRWCPTCAARAGDRVEGRRAQPRDVGQRQPQPGQPAHDAGAELRRAGETAAARARPGVAVNVSLSCSFGCPMEATCPRPRCSTGARATSTRSAPTA
jgi:hydroxymethylglutaryl-CoA lyase